MNTPARLALTLAASAAIALPALAQSPVAGPIEVFAHTDHTIVQPGQFTDFTVAIQNISTDSTAVVRYDVDLQYADGRHVQPFVINTNNPVTLPPGNALITFVFIQVPPDAPAGPATFTISARVGRVTGGTNHSDYDNPLYAVDSSSFLVDSPPSLATEGLAATGAAEFAN